MELPDGWTKDNIREYIEAAYYNCQATFANLPSQVQSLADIDRMYAEGIGAVSNSKDWFPGFFLLRSHASFLCAVQLTAGGQIPEAFMVLRGCLENALYGLYIYKNPKIAELWMNRNTDEASKKIVKSEFKLGKIMDVLEQEFKALVIPVKTLYERTIDYGAHPNVDSILSVLKREEIGDSVKFNLNYLDAKTSAHALCLKTTAQVGVASLALFGLVYKERFEILGLSEQIRKMGLQL